MASSKVILGALVPVVGAGLYAMQSRWWSVPTVQNEEGRQEQPQALALVRTASKRAKEMAENAQKAHTDYCERSFGEAPSGGKTELKRSMSKIHTNH